MSALVTTKKLCKSYGQGESKVEVLHDIDLTVQEGEFLALAGPSGSGKSTLLTLLGGLNRPDSGELIIDGIDLYSLSGERMADFRREYVGFVFQQFHLMPYLTALENVMLPLATTGIPAREQRRRAQELLQQMGLSGRENHLPGQLSGGEQERVAIARALVNKPALILADEPTGALDSQTGERIMALFGELNRQGMTIIMVTHNPDHLGHASRTIHMKDGRLR
ncbi:ATP-binding cassette domain-containing protein [Heliobacterium undosum]|uniref:ATP-binding cassette domain-containing protein n=1 Tax=Heliomicrobium undosum TaxID=121734 RepID=A0A845L079_9FIRM|nr:ABC transporter ATP-binding protein [Heliomicrobium undosum]MZP28285.1 ATP-binding cassette domain-containing protein [Heliomicrobium undosum]